MKDSVEQNTISNEYGYSPWFVNNVAFWRSHFKRQYSLFRLLVGIDCLSLSLSIKCHRNNYGIIEAYIARPYSNDLKLAVIVNDPLNVFFTEYMYHERGVMCWHGCSVYKTNGLMFHLSHFNFFVQFKVHSLRYNPLGWQSTKHA